MVFISENEREREKIIKENGIYGICNKNKQGEENTIVKIYKTTCRKKDTDYELQREKKSENEGTQRDSADSAGIFEQSMGARNRVGIGLSYRPARLHRPA